VIRNPTGDSNISARVVGLTLVNGVVTGVPVNAVNKEVRAYVPGVCNNLNPITGLCGSVTLKPNAGWVQAGFFAKELANGGAGLAPRNDYRTKPFSNTDMVFLKNTRWGKEGRYNFQIAAEAHNVFNHREINISGVGSGARSFVEPFTPQFLNYSYDFAVYGGRSVTMRAKFIF